MCHPIFTTWYLNFSRYAFIFFTSQFITYELKFSSSEKKNVTLNVDLISSECHESHHGVVWRFHGLSFCTCPGCPGEWRPDSQGTATLQCCFSFVLSYHIRLISASLVDAIYSSRWVIVEEGSLWGRLRGCSPTPTPPPPPPSMDGQRSPLVRLSTL